MGTLDALRATFGEDALHPNLDREPTHRWNELCVCGHIDRYHAPSTGGTYRLKDPWPKTIRGETATVTPAFFGCVGALKIRGFEETTATDVDREAMTMVERINPTCPCEDFRPVVKVDRPNRYFNQRMPKDSSDPMRHPFMVGIRAFTTFLNGRAAAKKDPEWADREFERRFVWLDEKRVCSMSRCKETGDEVWPGFVNGDGLSEPAVDPTDPVPDFVITVRIEAGYAIAEVMATTDADITVAMEDLHRHTVAEIGRVTWPLGYAVIETRWADVETINGRVQQMTAMAMLSDRDDADWESIRIAVQEDQADLEELQWQEQLKDLNRRGHDR